MATTIYNGLLYTTKEINRNFRIKINGIVDGKKVNKLVGVKGLIELIGVEMAYKMLRRAFNGTDDKTVCKLRRGIKISFYVKISDRAGSRNQIQIRMSSEKRNKLSEIFKLAWQFVKRNGYKLSEALKCAWLNIKLKAEMKKRIVKFYFQK